MTVRKGADLEELVRAYSARQGAFALRSVSYRFDDEEVTDIDVWSYVRQSASVRTRIVIDVKGKRSPKAFERVLWVKGICAALGCDRAIVATTDRNPQIARFARQQKVALLTKTFLDRLSAKVPTAERLTLEEFQEKIRSYPDQKQDGDWIRRLSEAKSAVISLPGFPAFNKAISAFKFFAERAHTRPQHREQASRAAIFAAALACVALDAALEQVVFEDLPARISAITAGVKYGDNGDRRTQRSIEDVLSIMSHAMDNGKAIAKRAQEALDGVFEGVRSVVIAEYFSKEQHSGQLFQVARQLDDCAHAADSKQLLALSIEAKSILGVFLDFAQVDRTVLLSGKTLISKEATVLEPQSSPDKDLDPASDGQPTLL